MAQRGTPSAAVENRLLAALPAAERARLASHLEEVELPLGKTLYEAGERKTTLYFITSGVVSLLQVTKNGASGEIALVGHDGAVGISMFMGGHSAPWRAVVQSQGRALGLPEAVLEREFSHGGPLHDILLRYTQTLMAQMAQTVICNRHHHIEQQLCRWILLSLDRLPSKELLMTQELIANMLGVRRAGITEAARNLQQAGIIRYVRGRISVLDRPRLEERVCECYALLKKETDRLFSDLGAYSKRGAQSIVRRDVRVAEGSTRHMLVAIPPPALGALERAAGSYIRLTPVHTFEQAIDRLGQNGNIAAVVCGVFFDEARMFDLLRAVRKSRPTLPFICCRILPRQVPDMPIESLKIAAENLGASFIDFRSRLEQYGTEAAESELRGLILAALGKERQGDARRP